MMLRYRLRLEPDDNETLLVTSPDLPIVTYGADEAEAFRHAADAINTMIQSLISAREDVPVPVFENVTGVPVHHTSLQTELKVRLHQAMRGTGMTRADLSRRLGWHREQVDRLFRLDHNSRLEQIEEAFAALNKLVVFDVCDAQSGQAAAA